ncbi:transcription termination/antitermination protein NusG [Porphyromonas sp. COT-239 OH1446]|uniref:transcription termination/antitermination protein NusG n=1 Tax=Porphyromonas sp. COT-239 OH1446 TaxID=1515613 RepID=UPI00052CCB42|nr:transcription termination/antitermination protein NusG [Porphyromonas sp. COT-239 OH1446]KGN67571.1 antitermination protein NusG [Porphyromonas sp. COT-239 OH1446]
MADVVEKRFYVLRAISGKEGKVKEQLEAEMRNTDLGQYLYQVIIPTEKVVTQRNGKKVVKERPYLPGYVLVEAALVGEVEHKLRNTQNVIGFLGSKGGSPEPLKRSEVDRILGKADQIADSEGEYDLELYVGDMVKVTDGAFVDCEAVIEDIMPDKRKVKVMVKMFGRKIPLELTYAQISKE